MRRNIKIVTIGGGSSFTPELVEGFTRRYDTIPMAEHWLVDVEEGREKVETVARLAQRMWDATGHQVSVRVAYDPREALADADFVTTQFRVGLLPARIKDERIPLSYGIMGQETNGAAAIFKALRTIPVIGQLIENMRELCPDAWLINFTNPSGMVTEAAIRNFGWERTIGICNLAIGSENNESKILGIPRDDLVFQFAGLNHFIWHRVFDNDGNELTEQLIERINDPVPGAAAKLQAGEALPLDLMRPSKLLACSYHEHYFTTEQIVEHELVAYRENATRAERVKAIEDELFALYADPDLDHKPPQLALRGGANYSDSACGTIEAINTNARVRMTVAARNRGAMTDLPYDSVVEVTSIVSAVGAEPLVWGAMPPHERGWLQLMKAMEELTITAAIDGDYGALVQAFNLNPLIPNGPRLRPLMHEMLVAHERYLPRFADVIAQLKADGVTITDETVRELMAEEG